MNTGPSVRLQPAMTGQGGRPMIFWEQQALEAKNQKAKKQQFGYKDKTVKRPLRDKDPGPEPKAVNSKGTTTNKEFKKTSNTRTGAQNSRNATKPKPDVNTVTLTQKQLDAILGTIGHLTLENEELAVKNPSGEFKGIGSITQTRPSQKEETNHSKGPGDHNTLVVTQSEIPGLENHVPPALVGGNLGDQSLANNTQAAVPVNNAAVSPATNNAPKPAPPMTKAELKRRQWELERVEQEKLEAQAAARVAATQIVNQQTGTASVLNGGASSGFSKMQQKRLQWEKEKAEMPDNFDPWGRPGAGAPIRDTGGSVLADYVNRKSQDYEGTGSKQAWADSNPQVLQKKESSPAQYQPTPSWVKDQPAAIRSSFAVGNIAPDEGQFIDVKDAQKKQWLADLEKQKEEKRLQKLREKQQQQDGEDRWADRFSYYKPAGVPDQATRITETERISSAPTAAPPVQEQSTSFVELDLSNSQSASHLRGQNAPLDPVTKKELEDKRLKYLEHQDALKAQMDERQRLKREEREERFREEREEEEKLAKERDNLNSQFENEKRKQRDKEEAQKRRVDVMKEAMDKAQQDAEREKHKRRLERLQQGGHDTSHLQANFEAKMTPRLVGGVIVPTPAVGTNVNPANVTVVAPTYIPGLHPTPRNENPPVIFTNDEPYVENRVLTPTLYRGNSLPKKEFGVQTDPSLLQKIQGVRDDFDLPHGGERNNRRVRLKSPSEEKGRKEVQKGPVKMSERPRWGASQQNKRSVKQSERDLRMQQKKEEAAARRLARQQQMLEMAERNAPRASQRTTNASRARSHSRNREDENAGHPRRHSPVDHYGHSVLAPESVNSRSRSKSRHQVPNQSPSREMRSVSHAESTHSRAQDYSNPDNSTSRKNHHNTRANRMSPPVPTISHRLDHNNDTDTYNHGNYDRITFSSRTPNGGDEKYQDSNLTGRTSVNSYVPFVRTQEILDPAHADDPVPISREATAIQRARQAYHESHEPASYGTRINNIEDRPIHNGNAKDKHAPENMPTNWKKDPIMNPTVVTGHPTPRQDRILQQLSDLRKGLRQKQRELEVGMSTMSLIED